MGQERQKDFYLHKEKNGVWYARFRDPATRTILSKITTGQTNQTRAEKWARAEWDKRAACSPDAGMRLGDWAGRFFIDGCPHETRKRLEGRQYGDLTRQNYRRLLEADVLPDPICGIRLCDLKRADLLACKERIAARRGLCRSADMAVMVLRIVVGEAFFRGIIPADPAHRLGGIAYKKARRLAVSLGDIRRLLSDASWESETVRLLVTTAAMTGMRAGELRALQWEDLDPVRGVIMIQRSIPSWHGVESVKLPKWDKLRVSPYPSALQSILEPRRSSGWVFSLTPGQPIGYTVLARGVKVAASSVGLDGLTLHGLRHSLQTALRESGVADEILRASFGWSDPSTQDNYTHRDLYNLGPQSVQVDTLFQEAPNAR